MPLSVSFAIRCQPRGVTLPLRRPSRGGLQGCSLDPCRLGCIDIVKQPSNLQIFNQVSGFNTSYGVIFHRISNCPTSCDAFPNRNTGSTLRVAEDTFKFHKHRITCGTSAKWGRHPRV